MRVTSSALGIVPCLFAATTAAYDAKSYLAWDCCKPSCSWGANLADSVFGAAKTCDVDNAPLDDGSTATSGCDADGYAFLCEDYAPKPVSDRLSYGFGILYDNDSCCKCYQVTWKEGKAAGKSMIVQSVNVFSDSDKEAVGGDDIIILTPGGGVWGHEDGCLNQYGSLLGNSVVGTNSANDCFSLPSNLQAGCFWRYNWAKGDINAKAVSINQVDCPDMLTDISGCSA